MPTVYCPTCDKDWNWPRRRGSMLRQCRCPHCGGPVELVTKQSPREFCIYCEQMRPNVVEGMCIRCIHKLEQEGKLLSVTSGLVKTLQTTLRTMRRRPRPDLATFRGWEERHAKLFADVNSLPLSDPERGPALAKLLECEDLLAEIIRLAEGATRDA